jgi:hypothetical protein
MNKFILSSALLLLFTSCSKNVNNSAPVICPTHPYTQWKEVKGLGLIDLTNGNILTINDDSTYHYNPKNFHYLYIPIIDSIGFLKSDNRTFPFISQDKKDTTIYRDLSFISRDKKDTTTFIYTMQNDTLHLGVGPFFNINMQGDMVYKKVH